MYLRLPNIEWFCLKGLMMSPNSQPVSTKCLYVEKLSEDGPAVRSIRTMPLDEIPANWVRVKVNYSSLNYKDALCATGHPGVVRSLPIVPGIDAAGTVLESKSNAFDDGDLVMVFHAAFGTAENGGMSEFIDVPEEWVFPIPQPLDSKTAMIVGTAGFTAAQCIDELQKHGVHPDSGEIAVTGATGGVGIIAVAMLAKLGYTVVASSGKPEQFERLRELGARSVVGREEFDDRTDRPLLKGRWAGAIDTVGGNTLPTILRSTKPQGCVTACGLVGGADLNLTVYPFILRGVTLQGVDTAGISPEYRSQIWQMIANQWMVESLQGIAIETDLENIESKIEEILAGKIAGRVIVKLN